MHAPPRGICCTGLVAVALLGAGCGDGDEGSQASEAAGGATTPTVSTDSLPDGLAELLGSDTEIDSWGCVGSIAGGQPERIRHCRVTIEGEKRYFDTRGGEWVEVDSPAEFR